jgi:hypothetical protein
LQPPARAQLRVVISAEWDFDDDLNCGGMEKVPMTGPTQIAGESAALFILISFV